MTIVYNDAGNGKESKWDVGSIHPKTGGMYRFNCYKSDEGFSRTMEFEISHGDFRSLMEGGVIGESFKMRLG